MDWLNQGLHFTDESLRALHFVTEPLNSDKIETVTLWQGEGGGSVLKRRHETEESFRIWAAETHRLSKNAKRPGAVLVMYPRLAKQCEYDAEARVDLEAKALRCSRETFRDAAADMFQHRSLALLFKRKSTAVVSSQSVTWNESSAPSLVYSCRSDTESPIEDDDIAMSATYFPETKLTFASIYGCTPKAMKFVKRSMAQIGESKQALHPLLLPMAFAEFERKRLLDMVDREKTHLQRRIGDVEDAIREKKEDAKKKNKAKDDATEVAERDCDSTKSWKAVSALRNGLESFKTQLSAMLDHSQALRTSLFASPPAGASRYSSEQETADVIEGRLKDMISELESKTRSADNLLGTMAMVTQMEWNYYARQDSQATIVMANASQRDSSQMRVISLMGMIFLPPTFLASVFSMQFFDWSAPETSGIVSPWASLYVALSLILMAVTLYTWRRWTSGDSTKYAIIAPDEEEGAIRELKEKAIWSRSGTKHGRKPSSDDSMA